jgi:hypothetical protein
MQSVTAAHRHRLQQRKLAMTYVTRVASVAIALMIQGITYGIITGA